MAAKKVTTTDNKGHIVKMPGWFSWRHETSDAHMQHQRDWRAKQQLKKLSAKQRQEKANQRSPQEQLDRLDARLGENMGAARERNRLLLQLQKEPGA